MFASLFYLLYKWWHATDWVEWGAAGELDPDRIEALTGQRRVSN